MGVGGVYDDRLTFVVGTSTLNQGGGFVFLVESAFVDKGDFLVSTDGVTNRYPILPVLFINIIAQSLTMVNVTQASCHILTYEPCERGTVHIMLSCDKIREHKLWSSENKKSIPKSQNPIFSFQRG